MGNGVHAYALAFTWVVVTTIVKYDLLEGACANHGLGRAEGGRERRGAFTRKETDTESQIK